MYRTKVAHPLNWGASPPSETQTGTLWSLFVAIGHHWELGDDPEPYRLRFLSFVENRVDLNPLYREYYRDGAKLVDSMVEKLGSHEAFQKIFSDKPRISPSGLPVTTLETLQRFVVNEFITLRLALGGFKAFGAENYIGYFGGANIEGEPIPYRSRGIQ